MYRPAALIADDEPLLRTRLRAELARLWPELHIVGDARNGHEALELFEAHRPAIVFLDVQMPGLNGIDTARQLSRRAHVVFITAYNDFALQAFDQGAIDYVLKPIDGARLADTVGRLKDRLMLLPAGLGSLEAIIDQIGQAMRRQTPAWLEWIRASVGSSTRLIPVDQVIYLRSEDKYTLVVWADGQALIRRGIRDLGAELDPARFVQIHRSVIVNLRCVREVMRGVNETAELHLHGRPEVLPVSRAYLHQFRQM